MVVYLYEIARFDITSNPIGLFSIETGNFLGHTAEQAIEEWQFEYFLLTGNFVEVVTTPMKNKEPKNYLSNCFDNIKQLINK